MDRKPQQREVFAGIRTNRSLPIDKGLIRTTKRKRYSAEIKAEVVFEAIREELTTPTDSQSPDSLGCVS